MSDSGGSDLLFFRFLLGAGLDSEAREGEVEWLGRGGRRERG